MSEETKIKVGIIAVAVEILVCVWVAAVFFCEDRAYDRHNIVIEDMIQ